MTRKLIGGMALGALAVVGLYAGLAALGPGAGFPLDDGWIHQTYARNLAATGRWEYVPGIVSAGSTAPLWTLWLALGYLLRVPHLAWAYLSGAAALFWLAWSGARLWRAAWPAQAARAWLPAAALLLSWPLVWAAASGMETLAYAALTVHLLALLLETDGGAGSSSRCNALLGAGAGALLLLRPEGLVLLLLVGVALALAPGGRAAAQRRLGWFILGALLLLVPYFLFNRWASGQWWPNTFYAKQAEYTALLSRPLPLRLLALLYYSVGGPPAGWRGISAAHLLLLPGLLSAGWRALQHDWSRKQLLATVPLLWAGGHVLLYAWRLPVTYQHGRYLLPAVPIWIIYGLAGWLPLLDSLRRRFGPLPARVLSGSFAALLLIFLLLGLQAYVQDVAFIESEMVVTAAWINERTAPDALIAAHDIGAIGYFTRRPLLDLAGLVSPDLVPLLTDEEALGEYVRTAGAAYLISAPGWPYEALLARQPHEQVFSSDYTWTRDQGLNNMTVYRLLPP